MFYAVIDQERSGPLASLIQMEYVLALAQHRSFVKAAAACFITQPTLSMQVSKLEDELGVLLFDRSRKPLAPTDAGVALIAQFRRVLDEAGRVSQLVNAMRGELAGPYRLGVIPTMAPWILPLIIRHLPAAHPRLELTVRELTTAEIIGALREARIDAGILATPLEDTQIRETPIFNEPFYIYHSPRCRDFTGQTRVRLQDLPLEKIVVMSEGHCLRTQVLDFCRLAEGGGAGDGFRFESGSVSTLLRIVDQGDFFTILPWLAVQELPARQRQARVLPFSDLVPFREVGLVSWRSAVKEAVHEAVVQVVRDHLPELPASSGRSRRLNPL